MQTEKKSKEQVREKFDFLLSEKNSAESNIKALFAAGFLFSATFFSLSTKTCIENLIQVECLPILFIGILAVGVFFIAYRTFERKKEIIKQITDRF